LWTGGSPAPPSVLGQSAAVLLALEPVEDELVEDVELLLLELDESLLALVDEDSLLAAGAEELSALRLSVR
jgi:hypothetical protein